MVLALLTAPLGAAFSSFQSTGVIEAKGWPAPKPPVIGYRILFSFQDIGPFENIGVEPITSTAYTLYGCLPGTRYYLRYVPVIEGTRRSLGQPSKVWSAVAEDRGEAGKLPQLTPTNLHGQSAIGFADTKFMELWSLANVEAGAFVDVGYRPGELLRLHGLTTTDGASSAWIDIRTTGGCYVEAPEAKSLVVDAFTRDEGFELGVLFRDGDVSKAGWTSWQSEAVKLPGSGRWVEVEFPLKNFEACYADPACSPNCNFQNTSRARAACVNTVAFFLVNTTRPVTVFVKGIRFR